MIKLENINKEYGEKIVFENLSLSIEENAVTAVLGESGVGKTTLLNILSGAASYTGKMQNDSRKVSFVFQEDRLVPFMTVNENLEFVLGKGDYTEKLRQVGIEEYKDSYPSSLSGGTARRVALLRAFLYDGDLMLMDEPFSALDLSTKYKVMQLFLKLWEQKRITAIIVTHDIEEAVFLAKRIVVLGEKGVIKGDFINRGDITRKEITLSLIHISEPTRP